MKLSETQLRILGVMLGLSLVAGGEMSVEDVVGGNESAVVTLTGLREVDGAVVQSSGCCIPCGFIVSTAHQVAGVRDLRARLAGGGEFPARVVAVDAAKEIALLQMDEMPPGTVEIGDAGRLRSGSLLVSIAAPANLDLTVVTGIVSSMNRTYRGYPVIQADMRAAPGSSGGPVFDGDGMLVGLIVGRLEAEAWVTVVNPVNNAYDLLRRHGVPVPDSGGLTYRNLDELENKELLTPLAGIGERDRRAVEAYNRGVAAKHPEEKAEAYAMAATLLPDFYEAWFNLGVAESERGDFAAAEAAYRRAAMLRPEALAPRRNLGRLLLRGERREEAVACFAEAVWLAPDAPRSHNDLGEAYRQAFRLEEAAEAFEKALRLDPRYAKVYYNLGLTYVQMGRNEEAVARFRQYLELTGDAADADVVRGWVAELTQ